MPRPQTGNHSRLGLLDLLNGLALCCYQPSPGGNNCIVRVNDCPVGLENRLYMVRAPCRGQKQEKNQVQIISMYMQMCIYVGFYVKLHECLDNLKVAIIHHSLCNYVHTIQLFMGLRYHLINISVWYNVITYFQLLEAQLLCNQIDATYSLTYSQTFQLFRRYLRCQ